jgi:hypothetical protein
MCNLSTYCSRKRLGDIDEQPDSKASRINELDERIAMISSRLQELLKTAAVDKDIIQLFNGKDKLSDFCHYMILG